MIYCGKSDAENEKKLEILSVSTFNFHVHWRGNVAKNGNSIKLSERERRENEERHDDEEKVFYVKNYHLMIINQSQLLICQPVIVF